MPIEFEILIQIRDLGDPMYAAEHRHLMTRRELVDMLICNPAIFEEHYGSEGLTVAQRAIERQPAKERK